VFLAMGWQTLESRKKGDFRGGSGGWNRFEGVVGGVRKSGNLPQRSMSGTCLDTTRHTVEPHASGLRRHNVLFEAVAIRFRQVFQLHATDLREGLALGDLLAERAVAPAVEHFDAGAIQLQVVFPALREASGERVGLTARGAQIALGRLQRAARLRQFALARLELPARVVKLAGECVTRLPALLRGRGRADRPASACRRRGAGPQRPLLPVSAARSRRPASDAPLRHRPAGAPAVRPTGPAAAAGLRAQAPHLFLLARGLLRIGPRCNDHECGQQTGTQGSERGRHQNFTLMSIISVSTS
jgi:hypothetical protein